MNLSLSFATIKSSVLNVWNLTASTPTFLAFSISLQATLKDPSWLFPISAIIKVLFNLLDLSTNFYSVD